MTADEDGDSELSYLSATPKAKTAKGKAEKDKVMEMV